MRWTQRSKGEWVCCVRSSRVVLAPRMLAKSSWEARFSGATVTTSSLHREEHEVSRKAIAQGMSVCSPLPCMLVCNFLAQASTRDRGCSAHPAPLRPLFKRGTRRLQNSGRACRENEYVCLHVIASEAIHLSACCGMDCFVASAPRNDGGGGRPVQNSWSTSFHARYPHCKKTSGERNMGRKIAIVGAGAVGEIGRAHV